MPKTVIHIRGDTILNSLPGSQTCLPVGREYERQIDQMYMSYTV